MLTTDEQKRHLGEQLDFLRGSVAAYDSGVEHEAKRIAAVIRTLFHNTSSSHALLNQMGAEATIVITTVKPESPYTQPDGKVVTAIRILSPLTEFAANSGGVKVVPMLDRGGYRAGIEAHDWWGEVLWEHPVPMTRRELVLSAANTDGGTHVDPAGTTSKYGGGYGALKPGVSSYSVSRGGEIGPEVALGNPQYADLRQLAHELLTSPQLAALVV